MGLEESKDQLWLTDLILTKALVSALLKRNLLNKDDILSEIPKSSASNDIALERAIKDAEILVENLANKL